MGSVLGGSCGGCFLIIWICFRHVSEMIFGFRKFLDGNMHCAGAWNKGLEFGFGRIPHIFRTWTLRLRL